MANVIWQLKERIFIYFTLKMVKSVTHQGREMMMMMAGDGIIGHRGGCGWTGAIKSCQP